MATTNGAFASGHTARILVFPFRERMAAKALPEQKFAAMEAVARRHPVAASSGSWYHDDAIAKATDKTTDKAD